MDRWESVWFNREGFKKKKEISLMSCCSSQFFIIRKPDFFLHFLNPFLYIATYHYFFPVWSPAVWNTACISASVTQGYYRVNVNGHIVKEMRDFDGNLFKNIKVYNE